MAGFDLKIETTSYGNLDNQDWLASAHGTDTADSITIDATAALTAFPDGVIPAGAEMSRNTTTGRYVPGWSGSGRDKPGFLLHSVNVKAGANPIGALHWHGEVITARVPLGVGGSAPSQSTHPLIRLV